MSLINSALFLGLLVDEVFSAALKKLAPEYLALFLNSEDTYLEEIHFNGKRYIGKYVDNEESLAQLELLEAHIFSLLKKLVSDYDYSHLNLVLFAVPQKV